MVPHVTGQSLAAAEHAIKAHNCRVGTVSYAFSTKVKKGRVISQAPKPHKRLKHGSKVNLVVSKGTQPKHALTVLRAGAGSGTVTGTGISCPGTCSHSYTAGTMVTLTASPDSGSDFTGWSGGGCNGTGTCTVTMNSDQAVTATFVVTPTLTVSRAGAGSGAVTGTGISCPGTCSHDYAAGAIVVLYETATAGSVFAGWSGPAGVDCASSPFCVVYMTKAQSVTATFQTVSSSGLTVHTWGSGSGTVTSADNGINCPGTCSANYAYGTQVTLTAVAASGSTFVGWSGAGCTGTGTCVATVESAQDVTATFKKTSVASEAPGAYTGYTGGSCCSSIYFYVSPDGGSLENVDVHGFTPSCTPNGTVDPAPVGISNIPIQNDGSFASTVTQSGLVNNQPATFTYTFNGQFSSTTAMTGTWREDVAYSNNGTDYSCTTGNESYAASWNSGQTNQNTATASPGSYTGYTERSCCSSLYFYVSPDGSSIENVDVHGFTPSCTPNGTVDPAPIGIASIPINSDGSFASTTTQAGLVANQPATFTYTFNGYVHGENGSGSTVITGTWREDVAYSNNGTGYSCTTNNETFSASLDSGQTNQNIATASPGSYTGYTERSCCSSLYFYVSPDGSSIENVDVPSASLPCSPTTESNLSSAVMIPSIPINGDGSFASTTTQIGLVANQSATFTYTFNGYVHGKNSSGSTVITGIWREDVTYANNGTSYSCTTNNQNVLASLDGSQTNQNTATASPGSYTGYTERSCCSSVYFYVSPDGSSIENVDVHGFTPSCTPNGTVDPAPIGISSIPINSDGSFVSTTTQTGLVANQPATFTYTFNGYVHGPGPDGLARITGVWREDVTYANNGTAYYCTTGNETFAAALDSGQSNQTTATASPGSYTGFTERSCCVSVYFTVSSDSSTITGVSIPSTSLACSPTTGSNLSSSVTIASIPINSDGSFSSTTSQSGLVGSQPATFTYTFNGYVHGPNSSGKTRINGIWREDVSYSDSGTAYSCTTNNESFAAVHS